MICFLSVSTASAIAVEGGGGSPGVAPTIAWGQHYIGQLDNHKADANYGGNRAVAFWRLPPVSTHDQVVVNWHALPFTHSSSFPVCMMFVQGVTDFTWGETFRGGSCESPTGYSLTGSGTASSQITVQNTDASGNTYLEFWSNANDYERVQETYPYDFTVEAPRHYLNMTISPMTEVAANGIVTATVTGADGSPPPEGLIFGLTVRWREAGIATYTAPSSAGVVAFQLALPESAVKKNVGFIAGRGADASFQAVETPVLHAKVLAPVVAAPPAPTKACTKARSRALLLARQQRRLARNSHPVRGRRRAELRRRVRATGKKRRTAKTKAEVACR